MPELPEVEHVTNALRSAIVGRAIERAELHRARLAPDTTPQAFARRLSGATVDSVTRRGKHILIGFDTKRTLLVHLRMSGRFHLLGADDADPKFSHAIFYFTDGHRLVFRISGISA